MSHFENVLYLPKYKKVRVIKAGDGLKRLRLGSTECAESLERVLALVSPPGRYSSVSIGADKGVGYALELRELCKIKLPHKV